MLRSLLAVSLLLAAAAPAQLRPYNLALQCPAQVIFWEGQPALLLWGFNGPGFAAPTSVAKFHPHVKSTGLWCSSMPSTLLGLRLVPQLTFVSDTRPCTQGRSVIMSDQCGSSSCESFWVIGALNAQGYYLGKPAQPVALRWWADDCMRTSNWAVTYCRSSVCDPGDPCVRYGNYGPEFWACIYRVELL